MAGNDSLEGHRIRQVYLITYSQADDEKVPSRNHFSQVILSAFSLQTVAEPLHWICSQEAHQDWGIHYHMAIYPWRKFRDHLASEQGIQLHFSDTHHDYYSTWQYLTRGNSTQWVIGAVPLANDARRRGSHLMTY